MQISFASKIKPAACQCHVGLFSLEIFFLTPGAEKQIGEMFFTSDDKAAKHQLEVTEFFAKIFLEDVGMPAELSKEKTVLHGDEAHAMVEKILDQPKLQ